MLAVSLLMLGWVAVGVAQTTYTITDLGTLGGSTGGTTSVAYGINTSGQIAGSFDTNQGGSPHAFLYSGGTMTDLGTLGGCCSEGLGINASGQVTGWSYMTGDKTQHAFLYSGGIMTDLGTLGGSGLLPDGVLGSLGRGINASGQITGFATLSGDTAAHAFLYSGGAMTDLGTLDGTTFSDGWSINASGQVTGRASGLVVDHAFLYSGGTIIDLGTLGGSKSGGTGINDSGQITGWAALIGDTAQHAFLYSGGTMIDLGTLGSSGSWSQGLAINASGQVTGWSSLTDDVTDLYAFLYATSTGMVDLNSLLPSNSGWRLNTGTGINDAGQITGVGVINGVVHAFLLSPNPPPSLTATCTASGSTTPLTALVTALVQYDANPNPASASTCDWNPGTPLPGAFDTAAGSSCTQHYTASSGGTFSESVTVTNGANSVTTNCPALIVQDFGLSATPSSATALPGGVVTYTVTASSINGFSGQVNLAQSTILPSGASAAWNPTSQFCTVPAGGSCSATYTVTVGAAAAGDLELAFHGTYAPALLTRSASATLRVLPPPSAPVITTISPASGTPGTQVAIFGQHFGTITGAANVAFNSIVAQVLTWSDTEIHAIVPIVPSVNISYSVTVANNGATSAPHSFLVLSTSSQASVLPPGQSNLVPCPGPSGRRILLVPQSSTGFSVLLFSDVTRCSTESSITSDITIENNWKAWYVVSVLASGSVAQGVPSEFLLGPGGSRIFRLTFKRGDSLTFFADATLQTPPVTSRDVRLLNVLAAELLWRAFFGSTLPQSLSEFALQLGGEISPMTQLALAALHLDLAAVLSAIEKIRNDPFLSTQLTALGVPIAEKISVLSQATRLFRVMELLTNEFVASQSFPSDSLLIRAE